MVSEKLISIWRRNENYDKLREHNLLEGEEAPKEQPKPIRFSKRSYPIRTFRPTELINDKLNSVPNINKLINKLLGDYFSNSSEEEGEDEFE